MKRLIVVTLVALMWSWSGIAAPAQTLVPKSEVQLQGGVQLDFQPWRAQVFVDGAYAGLVSEFTGYYRPLKLDPGPHVIVIVAPNYEPMIIGTFVPAGQTITYRGTLTVASGS